MLYRKIEEKIKRVLTEDNKKILIIDGARQVGKTYIVRKVGNDLFKSNFIEINFVNDSNGEQYFKNIKTTNDFYFQLSMLYGDKMDSKENTLIFIDEIQEYPQYLTMLKFFNEDNKFTFICSGSLLGITLKKTTSIPIGSIEIMHMYQLDFEEFLMANNVGKSAIDFIRQSYIEKRELNEESHNKIMDLFKKYILIGGLPECVNVYLESNNIMKVRKIQSTIQELYGDDASKYDTERKLIIKRIYDKIPSFMENKKKRVVLTNLQNKKGARATEYLEEFDYLICSGIANDVKAVSNPVFPLKQSLSKNLLKLYMNDIGLLSNTLYKNNIFAILNDEKSINLGSLYESVVASELKCHGYDLYYYDNKSKGEVDFLIDDYDTLSIKPIEIKSGKDYTVHSALNNLVSNPDYNVKKGYVFSNERKVYESNNIEYYPIYYIMFLNNEMNY